MACPSVDACARDSTDQERKKATPRSNAAKVSQTISDTPDHNETQMTVSDVPTTMTDSYEVQQHMDHEEIQSGSVSASASSPISMRHDPASL